MMVDGMAFAMVANSVAYWGKLTVVTKGSKTEH